MKKVNIYITLAFMLGFVIESCKKEPVVGGTAVQSMAGEWWVKLDGGNDPTGSFGPGYYNFSTYNTAANRPDSMWVDDGPDPKKSFYGMKGKVGSNISNLTFSGKNIQNQDFSSTFNITNGKIMPGATKAPGSGDKTDSIYFEIQFSDDPVPGTIHKVAGYKRTGFAQDDH